MTASDDLKTPLSSAGATSPKGFVKGRPHTLPSPPRNHGAPETGGSWEEQRK
jgi:hypothetical protein